ncbi:MAG: carboxymuconolactone decarboxylase family protein, partial [Nocardioides sp.]|nr:carboxymuconolactone decarboxylase family protein [Nocardioides sp.]
MSKFDDLPEQRRRGLEKMEAVYGFDMTDGEGDFFGYTADHLFADIWNRPGLSDRDRRLLLIGLLAGSGGADVL